jgi:hypothetical protein
MRGAAAPASGSASAPIAQAGPQQEAGARATKKEPGKPKRPPADQAKTESEPPTMAEEPARTNSRPPVVTADQRFEKCRGKLKAAHKNRVLHDLVWNGSTEPRVVVGPGFLRLSAEAKQEFAATINCFLVAGAVGQYISFDLLDWRSGDAVGRYSSGKVAMK